MTKSGLSVALRRFQKVSSKKPIRSESGIVNIKSASKLPKDAKVTETNNDEQEGVELDIEYDASYLVQFVP
jgi:hypothetical protein